MHDDAENLERLVKAEKQLIAETYERSIAYTNLVMAGGYAAFFGLWAMTKDLLEHPLSAVAALLMLTSAATFVFFEVYKMIVSGAWLSKRIDLFRDAAPSKLPSVLIAEMQDIQAEIKWQRTAIDRCHKRVLWVSVSTALLAVIVLAGALVWSLIVGPQPVLLNAPAFIAAEPAQRRPM